MPLVSVFASKLAMQADKTKEQTPLMRQYWEMKNLHTDKVLLFRMGDFFEMFFDDAVKAAPILGIALTSRNKKAADETPMCGVPHHSIGGQINKLLASGLKVAICDQIEDPKFAKGIVKRAVTRILTPGMVYDADTLEASSANYLGSLEGSSISLLDASTGEALLFSGLSDVEMVNLLRTLPLAELVVSPGVAKVGDFELASLAPLLISEHDGDLQDDRLLADVKNEPSASRLLSYVKSLEGDKRFAFLRPFVRRELQGRLEMSPTVLKSLEVFETQKNEKEGSLFSAVNRTRTSMGARLLRSRLAFPWCDKASLEAAWDQVDLWQKRSSEMKLLRERLFDVGDIERRLTRLAPPTCNARDLKSLGVSLHAAMDVIHTLRSPVPAVPLFEKILANFGRQAEADISELSHNIDRSLLEELPLSTKQGYMIREGVSPELDEAIRFSTHGQELLQEFENREKETSGIPSLKVRYNNVFGYYIEITNTHKEKAPAHYMRKQTLANAERFTTDELVELERKILSAQSRRADLESAVFEELKLSALKISAQILGLAQLLSEIDVSISWATLAQERAYVRPQVSEDQTLVLKTSRHAVVEQKLGQSFTANDIELKNGGCILLTGPNMAGKSTLMRQVALTVILAQAGGFVPASSARMPLFDRIFTRIGANDSLSEGLSTFMVEMKEAAEIVNGITPKSLVILDEIGRGTSTFDGMSLAQALLEHLINLKSGYLFFATHYHELTKLDSIYPQVHNAHMSVSDRGHDLRFLYSLRSGPALKSYGIHVAQLAGLPKSLTERATKLLKEHENGKPAKAGGQQQLSFMMDGGADSGVSTEELTELQEKLTELAEKHKSFVSEIEACPINQMTGVQALVRIAEWQSKLKTSTDSLQAH